MSYRRNQAKPDAKTDAKTEDKKDTTTSNATKDTKSVDTTVSESKSFKRGTTRRKTEYSGSKAFTVDELLEIVEGPPGWMSLDTKNEDQSQAMKEHNVRYITILAKGKDGKNRPIACPMGPTRTASRTRLGKSDTGTPSSCGFMTRIQVPFDHKEPDKKKRDEAAFKALEDIACDVVNEKFPGIPDDQFDSQVEKQLGLLKQEYKGWRILEAINAEFLRLLNDKKTILELKWVKTKQQVVRGFIQYDRKYNPEVDKLEDVPEDGAILLKEPIAHHKIRIDKKTGQLWCKIYDVTQPVGKDGKRKLATEVNPKTGKMEIVNMHSVEDWLRYNSPCVGEEKFQLCICKEGALLHATLTELNVRRAAKSEMGPKASDKDVDALGDYGGEFEGLSTDSSSDKLANKTSDKSSTKSPKSQGQSSDKSDKSSGSELLSVEEQLQSLQDS